MHIKSEAELRDLAAREIENRAAISKAHASYSARRQERDGHPTMMANAWPISQRPTKFSSRRSALIIISRWQSRPMTACKPNHHARRSIRVGGRLTLLEVRL